MLSKRFPVSVAYESSLWPLLHRAPGNGRGTPETDGPKLPFLLPREHIAGCAPAQIAGYSADNGKSSLASGMSARCWSPVHCPSAAGLKAHRSNRLVSTCACVSICSRHRPPPRTDRRTGYRRRHPHRASGERSGRWRSLGCVDGTPGCDAVTGYKLEDTRRCSSAR